METIINIVDAICGAGKTSWAIQRLNEVKNIGFGTDERTDKKYIYVTPYLDEVARLRNDTKADFYEPDPQKGKGSKLKHLKMMVELGLNIITTHEIFKRLDEETLNHIEAEGYTLIMDEAAQVIESINDISDEDIEYLLRFKSIEIGDLGKVKWIDEEYGKRENSRYRDIKIMADNGTLYIQNDQAFYWTMNVRAFEVFDEVYILTYLFDAQMQKYYYDMFDVKYKKHSVLNNQGRYELVKYNPLLERREELYNLLAIYEGKLNYNFDHREDDANSKELKKIRNNQLSGTWLEDRASEDEIKKLNKNLLNFFLNHCDVPVNRLYWTTLSRIAPAFANKKCKYNRKGDRIKDNFLPFNARATNTYADRTAMAFVYNRFMNPNDKKFFTSRGVEVNEDLLAVSDLIQFLFRGCIRNGERMNCYIPSYRMRELLRKWANYEI
ncbi:hypothetical protein [Rossellomorea sp. FM04394]|uniref:hypothetical protein n=1 Tax=Rossellomorea sp. FM04394 TaxID=3243076 RepID=UPI0035A6C916